MNWLHFTNRVHTSDVTYIHQAPLIQRRPGYETTVTDFTLNPFIPCLSMKSFRVWANWRRGEERRGGEGRGGEGRGGEGRGGEGRGGEGRGGEGRGGEGRGGEGRGGEGRGGEGRGGDKRKREE